MAGLKNAKMNTPLVSIIIPCKNIDLDTRRCIDECLNLDYPDFEILVLPDSNEAYDASEVSIISTGPVKPSTKRNLGMGKAKGEVFAFIDSDAYPKKDWLNNAVKCLLSSSSVGAVTGPNLTPSEDSYWQKVGGDILASYVGLGRFSKRYKTTKTGFEATDIMSCNFVLPKEVAENLNGFDDSLLTGEDYKFGLEILGLDKKIIYSPNVSVFHHRRPVFLPHLRQMWNYGRDKGLLMREFFSIDKIIYFLPSLFVGWLLAGMVIFLSTDGIFSKIYLFSVFVYLMSVFLASFCSEDKRRTVHVFLGICATHITYGIAFIKGIITRKSTA